jgi:hypothetical protein
MPRDAHEEMRLDLVGYVGRRLFEYLGYRQGYFQSLIEEGDMTWLSSADLEGCSEGIVTFGNEWQQDILPKTSTHRVA